MFRNRFWGGLFAVLLFVLIASLIAFAGFQLGLAQGAGGDLVGPRGGPMTPHHGFFFFPFFWGFGLLKFFFFLFLIALFFRLVFRPWGMGRWGHWKDHPESHGPWGDRMKEMHDRWHETQADQTEEQK